VSDPGGRDRGAPIIDVDARSPIPPYEQIRAQLAGLIESGAVAEGTRLPPIRQLAADLDLAPGTVARAYRALEAAGLVTGRARTGTTVTAGRRPTAEQAEQRLDRAAHAYAATARALGLTHQQAIAALNRHAAGPSAG
jgi:DNA-binding transcriptional regulator YhcF (GntR family)